MTKVPHTEVFELFGDFGRRPKLMLVDGNNLLMRSIKAMEHSRLSSDDGVPTAAIHTFIRSFAAQVNDQHPSHLMVCWDGGTSQYRLAIYPDYKGQRESSYEANGDPFDLAWQWCDLMGVQQVRHEGWEADDLIASAVINDYWDEEIVILSGDKDFLQLVDDHRVTQVRPKQEGHWTRRRVIKEYGVEPEDVPLVLAMMGDASDNIPGIKGVGVKTAAKYIRKHGTDIATIVAAEKRLTDDDAEVIERNVRLIDLRTVEGVPPLPELCEFIPTSPVLEQADDLLLWFSDLDLAQVASAWIEGRLFTTSSG